MIFKAFLKQLQLILGLILGLLKVTSSIVTSETKSTKTTKDTAATIL